MIKNSIILNDVYIGDNTVIETVLLKAETRSEQIPHISVTKATLRSLLKQMKDILSDSLLTSEVD